MLQQNHSSYWEDNIFEFLKLRYLEKLVVQSYIVSTDSVRSFVLVKYPQIFFGQCKSLNVSPLNVTLSFSINKSYVYLTVE